MKRNILITGAKMVLPNGIQTGDLRISDGIISEISTDGNLESKMMSTSLMLMDYICFQG